MTWIKQYISGIGRIQGQVFLASRFAIHRTGTIQTLHLRNYIKSAHKMSIHPDSQVIDLRSDTLTQPPAEMRQAMAEAVVGDDVYGEDPTVNELQRRCAELFGKEAALFVPTGTMGNLISTLVHCQQRGLEAVVGHKSHILLNEQGGIAQFAGVMTRTIHNKADGTFDLDELERLIRPRNDPHQPWTHMVCLENSHNFCGGKALPMSFIKKVYSIAKNNNLVVHTDGARVLNSAVALGVQPSEIVQYSDSLNMCFSKGLAAPVGSVIAGTKSFIDMGLRMRKALGGGMRQAGVLAAAALYSLDHIYPRLLEDHEHALMISDAILEANSGVLDINKEGINTNIITLDVVKPGLSAAQFCQRMAQVTEAEKAELGESIVIKMNPIYPHTFRFVTHNDVTLDMVNKTMNKFQYVVKEFGQS